jgi:tetratricopeptide (TPR) repeat protein
MGYVVENIAFRENRGRLEELFKKINADLVIVLRGDGIPPSLIRDLSCPTVLWYGEVIAGNDESSMTRYYEVKYNAEAFDYVIWCGEEDLDNLEVLRTLGCSRIGYAYPCRLDPAIYRKLELPKLYDVSFVGSLTPRRKQILGALAQRFKVEFRNIWDVEEQVRFYNQSRIVLHINFAPFITTASINMRAFDIIGSGTFLLCEDGVFNKQLKDGEHLVYWRYNDIHDLAEKVRYYLDHEEEREKIAESGHHYVRQNFFIENFIKNLLNQVDFSLRAPGLRGKGHGVALDRWGRQTFSTNELQKALEPATSMRYQHSFYERGKLYFQLKRWRQAAYSLENAVEIESDFINAMHLLALSYVELKRPKDAAREFRRLLKVAPCHAQANLALGELYTALGDVEHGKYYKQKGMKLSPRLNS